MKYLKPQPLHEKYYEPVEVQLKDFIYQTLYAPLRTIIEEFTAQKVILNASAGVIEQAIMKGLVQYNAGIFSGKFNAAISRELRKIGARFDKRMKVFKMDAGKVPAHIRVLAAQKQAQAKDINDKIKAELDKIQESLPAVIEKTKIEYTKLIDRVTKDFKEIYRQIEVEPDESEGFKKAQDREYSERARPFIKGWTEEEILQLRQDVTDNALAGYRADQLIKRIQKRHGTSKVHAKFIAKQETAIFMSNYRKLRFTSSGVKRFKWSTSGDSRVRDDHRDLNGRIFSYDNPPIVDKATGKHGLPGSGSFGCRCVDIAIVEQ